ncbi:unnamed protein product [Ambrosiozyma monospora]|uniref:Unnamed protein product n=1 Tax=Ambrosiozyma monospora TaxID=43982 RepID=A0A9W7DGN9_AMBMO|nr:unnamed protein product [Ambrosiozyma monospora]
MTGKLHQVPLCLPGLSKRKCYHSYKRGSHHWNLALQVDSWFQLTEKSDIHLTLTRTDTVDPDHLLTPNQDLLKVIRLKGDTSQRQMPHHPKQSKE